MALFPKINKILNKAQSSKKTKQAMLGFAAVLILVSVYFIFFHKEAVASWWNEDWAYRQAVTISNTNGADLTDFQIKLTVDTFTLASTSKMQSDCDDIRFTDNNGQLLDYWIEENSPGCNSATTSIWIKVPKIFDGASSTAIYMYYGNPSAASYQNGDNAFLFFDDFDDGAIDNEKWAMSALGSGTSYVESAGLLHLSSSNNLTGSSNAKTISTFTNNFTYELRRLNSEEHYNHTSFGYGEFSDGENGTNWWITYPQNGYCEIIQDNSNYFYTITMDGISSTTETMDGPDAMQWTKHKTIYSNAGLWNWYFDTGTGYALLGTGQTDTDYLTNEKYILLSRGGWSGAAWGGTSSIDYIFARKYAATDPLAIPEQEETGPGPVAYWKFDEGQGATVYDSSPNRNNGSLGGATADYYPAWAAESECISGKCLKFDGQNDYVLIEDNNLWDFSGKERTISLWFRTTGPGKDGWGNIFNHFTGGIPGAGWLIEYSNSTGAINFNHRSSSASEAFNGANDKDYNDSRWHFIEVTMDGSTSKLYMDGVYLNQSSYSDLIDYDSNLYIGGQYINYGFTGYIDEVKMYGYARTADQVKQDYNAGLSGMATNNGVAVAIGGNSPKWMTDGLVGYWSMDEASGTLVADLSGNGNNGTLTNAQETDTAAASSGSTTIVAASGASLSNTDDAYNGMILYISGGPGCEIATGTERVIEDYATSTGKTFTVKDIGWVGDGAGSTGKQADNCNFEIRHQTTGKFRNGAAFDGGNDYVDAGSGSSLNANNNKITISAWIKRTGEPAGEGHIVSKWSSGQSYTIDSGGNYPYFFISNGSDYPDVRGSQLVLGRWHHIVASYDGSKMQIFQDGVLVDEKNTDIVMQKPDNNLCFGSRCDGMYQFKGIIDEVRIYNRALSPTEAEALYEWGPGPVGWWKFDDNVAGSAKTLIDSSGYGNNALTNDGSNNTGMDCTVAGKYGGACKFDGVDDQIEIWNFDMAELRVKEDFTAESWVRLDPNAACQGSYIFFGGGSGPCFYLAHNGDCYYRLGWYSGDSAVRSDLLYLERGRWYHIAMTRDIYRKSVFFFLDGVLIKEYDISLTEEDQINKYNYPVYIGGVSWPHKGLIDDVRYYEYARTQKQILEDMNGGNPNNPNATRPGATAAYYKFDEGHGLSAQDSSNNNQDLTISTTTAWTMNGKFGRALDFEKDDSMYAWTADSAALSITGDLSLTGWIKPESLTAATLFDIAGKWDDSSESYLLSLYGDELRMYIDSASSYKTTNSANISTNTWYHVAGVYRATSTTGVTLYVNGMEQAGTVNGTIPYGIGDDAGKLFIGAEDTTGTANFFDGIIDDFKIYPYALSSNQIAIDMNQGKGMAMGGGQSATGATGQASEYCIPGDTAQCDPPVGEWKLEEKSGTNAKDTSGNGRSASITGAVSRMGKYGNGLHFRGPGNDDYADIESAQEFFSPPFSASLWLKMDKLPDASHERAICQIRGSSPWVIWLLEVLATSNKLNFAVIDSGGTLHGISSDSAIAANQWYHIELILESDYDMVMYVNGKKQSSTANSSSIADDPDVLRIGGSISNVNTFEGLIDDVRIFNYVRTPAQVAWDYNRGKPIAHWKMDECQGTRILDWSDNKNHGVLQLGESGQTSAGTCANSADTAWYNGRNGKFNSSLNFDGSDDYVNMGSPTNGILDMGSNDFSISTWVKCSDPGSDFDIILSKHTAPDDPVGSGSGFQMNTHITADGRIRAYIRDGTNNRNIDGPAGKDIRDGNWHHIIYTADRDGNGIIYVDGLAGSAGSLSGVGSISNSANFTIGGPLTDYYFPGQIDGVRIYNYALTAEQAQQAMNDGSAVRFGD